MDPMSRKPARRADLICDRDNCGSKRALNRRQISELALGRDCLGGTFVRYCFGRSRADTDAGHQQRGVTRKTTTRHCSKQPLNSEIDDLKTPLLFIAYSLHSWHEMRIALSRAFASTGLRRLMCELGRHTQATRFENKAVDLPAGRPRHHHRLAFGLDFS